MNNSKTAFLIHRVLFIFVLIQLSSGSLLADDWDPNDDTFDPTIHSVVVGEASWLGDPSPFVHVELRRTGYTHVMNTEWKGFEPSVQISLMVPLKRGQKKPQGTGMIMMNRSQTLEFMKNVEARLTAKPKAADSKTKDDAKPMQIKSAFKDANWTMASNTEKGEVFVEFANTSKENDKEKVNTYRFSINATKKLLGAIQHSLTKVKTATP